MWFPPQCTSCWKIIFFYVDNATIWNVKQCKTPPPHFRWIHFCFGLFLKVASSQSQVMGDVVEGEVLSPVTGGTRGSSPPMLANTRFPPRVSRWRLWSTPCSIIALLVSSLFTLFMCHSDYVVSHSYDAHVIDGTKPCIQYKCSSFPQDRGLSNIQYTQPGHICPSMSSILLQSCRSRDLPLSNLSKKCSNEQNLLLASPLKKQRTKRQRRDTAFHLLLFTKWLANVKI